MTYVLRQPNLSRREFGLLAGTAGLAMGFAPGLTRRALADEAANAAKIIAGKSSDMIVHNAKLGVMETPLALLRKYPHTPKEILFNRLHFPVDGERKWTATTAAPEFKDWTILVDGLVQRSRQVTLADLMTMDQVKRVSVMQCAGNGRSYYAAKAKAPGGQWKHGGMGNIEWEGVPLRPLLDDLKLAASSEAVWLTANGRDDPPEREATDFAKSYHIDDPALDNAILALKMNGEPIPASHGGPVRLIIPGYYGNMNVKYVTNLLLDAAQSPSAFQSKAYRFPNHPVEPGKFSVADYTTSNSRPTYGFQIMSVIFSPLAEDTVKHGSVEIAGVAWNDGTAPITSVEVSTDGGASWRDAMIEPPESPWAWHHWKLPAKLAKGTTDIMCRATDAFGRTQPLDGTARWQPKGYEWNGVDRVAVTVT